MTSIENSSMTLNDLAHARDDLLARLTRHYAADDRVAAAWLAGSFGRGVADAWSDLDLHVFVHDGHLAEMLEERAALYEQLGPPLLVQPEIPANATFDGSFQLVIFPGGVELDLTLGPLSQAMRPAAIRLLFDRVGVPLLTTEPMAADAWRARAEDRLVFFWAMAPIAAKYAGRGSTLRLVRMIDLLSETWVDLWNLLNGDPMAQLPVNVTNASLDSRAVAQLPDSGRIISPESGIDVVEAMCADVASWHQQFSDDGVAIPADMPNLVTSLIAIARNDLANQ